MRTGSAAGERFDEVLKMSAPVPTGKTPGERLALSLWGKALENVGKKHADLPAIRRGQRLHEANKPASDDPE